MHVYQRLYLRLCDTRYEVRSLEAGCGQPCYRTEYIVKYGPPKRVEHQPHVNQEYPKFGSP